MKRNRASASFMTRLGRDQRGNTIAIVAAAIVPLLGMIGGGIDMSRLYLAKTRLQQACDAGALAGRRAMGSGAWSENTATSSEGRAEELFRANFASGAYGTTLKTMDFSQADGVVTGKATVDVPMSIMKIFGMSTRSVSVECTAKMEIPNTDVMFVLDVTGSMNCRPGDASCVNNGNVPATGAKIRGLKSAVKCFYEALTRVNTSEVCGNDPAATSYAGTAQIRMGFMPYSVNVNVGKLLPNSFMADTFPYQTRTAVNEKVWTWKAGTMPAADYTKSTWQPFGTIPTNITSTNSYNSFVTVADDNNTLLDGNAYPRKALSANSKAKCEALNTFGGVKGLFGVGGTGKTESDSTFTPIDNNPPVYPNKIQNQQATQTRDALVTKGYLYTYSSSTCWLQSASKKSTTTTFTQQRVGTAALPINWVDLWRAKWTYDKLPINVSGLKAGGAKWNNSITLPVGTNTIVNTRLSGSNTPVDISAMVNTSVPWDGCIEEVQTIKNSGGKPSDDWVPFPKNAYDMTIDIVPKADLPDLDPNDGITSYWGPMLPGAVWGRYNSNGNSFDPVITYEDQKKNMDYFCSTEAKKLQTWTTPSSFESYVNSLTAIGNTYHDIGMIWGARFISPTGIFASENAATPDGGTIQRHIIFMTDGDTMTSNINYSAYGIHWWDRRQTTYAPDSTQLNNILNARLEVLCEGIKARNIRLWVVSYGGDTNATTEARLKKCATSESYFIAKDTPTLISNFKDIASKIAALRLAS